MRTFTVATDPATGRGSLIADDGTVMVGVHPEGRCAGERCVIHAPSEHHMRGWPLVWRDDRRMFERLCPCGVGHPDPDQREYLASRGDPGVHGCCGCCRPGAGESP